MVYTQNKLSDKHLLYSLTQTLTARLQCLVLNKGPSGQHPGRARWFLGRVTDRWCNPEENNQTAELMGKWKILKYHWIKVCLYLALFINVAQHKARKKKKRKEIKSFPSWLNGNKKSWVLWRENTQSEHLEQRMQLECSLQALCWAQISGTVPSALLSLHLQLQLSEPSVCVRTVDPFELELFNRKWKTSW